MNNLDLIKENIHLVENAKLFTRINKQIFDKIIEKLKLENEFKVEDLGIDNQLIDKINKFASNKKYIKK